MLQTFNESKEFNALKRNVKEKSRYDTNKAGQANDMVSGQIINTDTVDQFPTEVVPCI